jgi:hypothetical protein
MYIFLFIPLLRFLSYVCYQNFNHYDIEYGSKNIDYQRKKNHIIPKFIFYTIFALPTFFHTYLQATYYNRDNGFTWDMYVVNILYSSILFDRFKETLSSYSMEMGIDEFNALYIIYGDIKINHKLFKNKKSRRGLFGIISYVIVHINILFNINKIWYTSFILYSMLYIVLDYLDTILYILPPVGIKINQTVKHKLLKCKQYFYVATMTIQIFILLKEIQLFSHRQGKVNIYALVSYFLLPIYIVYDPIFKDLFCRRFKHIF